VHRAPFPQATPACTLSRMKRPATYAQAKDSTDANNMECSLDAGAGFHIDSGKEDHRSMTAVSSSTAFAETTPMEDKPAFLGGMPEPDERRGNALVRHAGSERRANSIRPKSAAQVAAPLTKRFRTADRRVDLREFTDVIRRNEPSVPRVAFMLRHKIVGKSAYRGDARSFTSTESSKKWPLRRHTQATLPGRACSPAAALRSAVALCSASARCSC
jgi:hypothetical protein